MEVVYKEGKDCDYTAFNDYTIQEYSGTLTLTDRLKNTILLNAAEALRLTLYGPNYFFRRFSGNNLNRLFLSTDS